jgi:hypothetical protein
MGLETSPQGRQRRRERAFSADKLEHLVAFEGSEALARRCCPDRSLGERLTGFGWGSLVERGERRCRSTTSQVSNRVIRRGCTSTPPP